METEDIARLGPALAAAARVLAEGSPLGSNRDRLASMVRVLADAIADRIYSKGSGRFVERMTICAGCGEWGRGAVGWLVWTSQANPSHDMALPICGECSDKARGNARFVKAEEKRRALLPLRFEKDERL